MPKALNAIDAQVGANMRFLRLRYGLSQEALAEKLGITFQQVQKYEKGANRISASKIVMTSRVFGCSIADLFHGVEETSPTAVPIARADHRSSASIKAMDLFDAIPRKQRTALLELLRALAVSNKAPEDEDE